MSFNEDRKWIKAKKIVGVQNSWLEILRLYKDLGGENVFIYTAGNKDRHLIVDIKDDDTVILLDKTGNVLKDSYDNVNRSKKIFSYSENPEETINVLDGEEITILVEK